jgi:hypothetical protein
VLNFDYNDRQSDEFAEKTLKKQYKYPAYSFGLGCSCYFEYAKDVPEDMFDENELNKQAVEALFEYLRANVKGSCELLSIWTGDFEIKSYDTVDLKNFVLGDSFRFLQGQHITVYN